MITRCKNNNKIIYYYEKINCEITLNKHEIYGMSFARKPTVKTNAILKWTI